MIDLSILIVCYKSRELIVNCLNGVYQHTSGCKYEVLLVDCSNDGTVDLVREQFPDTRIIMTTENLGYGKGNNFLAEHATGKYLLLLNPDVIVSDDAIGELYRTAIAFPEAGAVGGITKLLDGSHDPSCRQYVPTLFRLAAGAVGGGRFLNGGLANDATDASAVDTLSGAFMLVRRDAWEQAKGFDTTFFMYSEELDLCQRLRSLKWDIIMTPRARIIHLVGSGQKLSPRRILLITQSRMHFFRKYWRRPQVAIGGALVWLHATIRVAAAMIGTTVTKSDHAVQLKQAYKQIVFHPSMWWYGFQQEDVKTK